AASALARIMARTGSPRCTSRRQLLWPTWPWAPVTRVGRMQPPPSRIWSHIGETARAAQAFRAEARSSRWQLVPQCRGAEPMMRRRRRRVPADARGARSRRWLETPEAGEGLDVHGVREERERRHGLEPEAAEIGRAHV